MDPLPSFLRVEVRQTSQGMLHDKRDLRLGESAITNLHDITQRTCRAILHNNPDITCFLKSTFIPHNVGRVALLEDVDLFPKLETVSTIELEDFYRNVASVTVVERFVDCAVAAFADLGE